MWEGVFLFLWSIVLESAVLVLRVLAVLRPSLQPSLHERRVDAAHLRTLLNLSSTAASRLLFLSSSAGEYEQALPIIERARAEGYQVLVVFFSPSGPRFVRARGDRIPYILAPYDSLWQWRKLYALVRPEASLVIRHELWPGFLAVARRQSKKLYLLNASRSSSKRPPWFVRWSKGILLNYFERIFCVTAEDAQALHGWYNLPCERLSISGDSKYDRVLQNFDKNSERVAQFRACVARYFPVQPWLIVGSAWPQDYGVVLAGLGYLRASSPHFHLGTVIALHEPTAANVAVLEQACHSFGLSPLRWSALWQSYSQASPLTVPPHAVILVDGLGLLAPLYGIGSCAVVGGALHHKVHNVLEPASYGLAIAHGPLYKNSAEAIALVDAQLSTVIHDRSEFARWCHNVVAGQVARGETVRRFLEERSGASASVFAALTAP